MRDLNKIKLPISIKYYEIVLQIARSDAPEESDH